MLLNPTCRLTCNTHALHALLPHSLLSRFSLHIRTSLAVLKEAVPRSLGVLPLHGRRGFFVRYAKKKVTLQMNVGGVMVMMMMTLPLTQKVHMALTQIGIWTLVLQTMLLVS
jgi:hypothetical protein